MRSRPQSISESLRELVASVVAIGRTRVELFSIEFAEQKENVVRAGVLAAVGLLCLAMAAAVFTAFIIVAFWDTPYRLLAVGLVGLAWLLGGLVCLWRVVRNLREAKHPFVLTLAELERDYEVLTSPLADPDATPAAKRAVRTRSAGASGAYNPADPGNPS